MHILIYTIDGILIFLSFSFFLFLSFSPSFLSFSLKLWSVIPNVIPSVQLSYIDALSNQHPFPLLFSRISHTIGKIKAFRRLGRPKTQCVHGTGMVAGDWGVIRQGKHTLCIFPHNSPIDPSRLPFKKDRWWINIKQNTQNYYAYLNRYMTHGYRLLSHTVEVHRHHEFGASNFPGITEGQPVIR